MHELLSFDRSQLAAVRIGRVGGALIRLSSTASSVAPDIVLGAAALPDDAHVVRCTALLKRRQQHKVIPGNRFQITTGPGPGVQTPCDYSSIEAVLSHDVRHTGACGFPHSTTVEVYFLVARQVFDRCQQTIWLNPNRALDAESAVVVVAMTAHIHNKKL